MGSGFYGLGRRHRDEVDVGGKGLVGRRDLLEQLPPLGELRLGRPAELDDLAVHVHEERRQLALERVRELGEGRLVDPCLLALLEPALHRGDAAQDQDVLDAPGAVVARLIAMPASTAIPPRIFLSVAARLIESSATCSV